MKKIKKFINFEVVTILTILILILTFYFVAKYSKIEKDFLCNESITVSEYQILADFKKTVEETDNNELFKVQVMDLENNLLYISNSDFELIAIIVGSITFVLNILVATLYIILIFIEKLTLNKCKKILSEYDSIDEIDVPQYDIFIANTLYTGRISFSKIFNFLGQYFRENEMIDKKGKINSNININNLSELEKDFIELYEKSIEANTKKQFKNKIVKELEDKKYLKTNKLRKVVEKIYSKAEDFIRYFFSFYKEGSRNTVIELLVLISVIYLITIFKYFSIIIIIGIIYTYLKFYNLFLTTEGKKEKAKIILLMKKLKTKEELTENEKFFYDALKYINL